MSTKTINPLELFIDVVALSKRLCQQLIPFELACATPENFIRRVNETMDIEITSSLAGIGV